MVASAQGVDVSNYQGNYDWAGTHGLSFGLFRLTQGLPGSHMNSPDPTAQWNHREIFKKGLHRGAYHYNEPSLSGPAQATYFVDEMTKLGITRSDIMVLDHEDNDNLPPTHVAAQGVAFMKELDILLPHNPNMVYTFIDFIRQGNCVGMTHWPLYLAHPGATSPSAVEERPWTNWKLWQWGVRSVDRDAFNGTASDMDAWIASFIPRPRLLRRIADGKSSFADAVLAVHDTVPHAAKVTIESVNHHNAVAFVEYLVTKGPAALMPPGLVYWTEAV